MVAWLYTCESQFLPSPLLKPCLPLSYTIIINKNTGSTITYICHEIEPIEGNKVSNEGKYLEIKRIFQPKNTKRILLVQLPGFGIYLLKDLCFSDILPIPWSWKRWNQNYLWGSSWAENPGIKYHHFHFHIQLDVTLLFDEWDNL